ncbi:MAG: outer spore coat protein CotE [Firmicutes bacterium]|nr:outer spore coat protein CotE [Bacillota bacterium]
MAFKEIVTKAVIGKAKKTSRNDFLMETEQKPNTILGCWVINHLITVGDKI